MGQGAQDPLHAPTRGSSVLCKRRKISCHGHTLSLHQLERHCPDQTGSIRPQHEKQRLRCRGLSVTFGPHLRLFVPADAVCTSPNSGVRTTGWPGPDAGSPCRRLDCGERRRSRRVRPCRSATKFSLRNCRTYRSPVAFAPTTSGRLQACFALGLWSSGIASG